MSRVSNYQEGHGVGKLSYDQPAKKRKNRKKGFRLNKELKNEKGRKR